MADGGSSATNVNDVRTLKEIDTYLATNYPQNRAQVEEMMGKWLNIDIRGIVGGAIAGLPFGIGAKLALFAVRTVMNRGIYASYRYMLPRGVTPFSPATDANNYVGYLLYTWKESGAPSYRVKWGE